MKTSRPHPAEQIPCLVRRRLRPAGFVANLLGLLLVIGCFGPTARLAGASSVAPLRPGEAKPATEPAGPTLHLNSGRGEPRDNSISEFMYFVPLISPEPVAVIQSTGNTQRARMVSATRSFTTKSFVVICEFELAGEGNQQNVFDHTDKVLRSERELRAGGSLDHQLSSINVEGAGRVSIEVEGTLTGQVPTVTEVRLRFNAHGQPSLVTIGLQDIGYSDGAYRVRNETVARVNTLSFRSKPGPTKMDITVASVKRKDAGNGFWQNIMGDLKATTVNMLLKPVAVEPLGNEAMLHFGLALVSDAPAFTFPLARNLKKGNRNETL